MSRTTTQRLLAQRIAAPCLSTPEGIVGWLGAVQAQDYTGGKWALGLRLPGSTDETVEEALQRKQILRTWTVRGTLHFAAAADIGWLLALLGPIVIARNARRYRELELDESTLARSCELLAGALSGGEALDRGALRAVLAAEGISTAGQRMVYMLQHASLQGRIAQMNAPQNRPLFVTLDDVPALAVPRSEATAELARRYFCSRGPATAEDFIWWSGLPAAEARAGLAAAAPELRQDTVDGRETWRSPHLIEPPAAQTAFLLPPFDEYLLGYREREAVLREPQATAWRQRNAQFPATVVINGRVAGFWSRLVRKDKVLVIVERMKPPDEAVQAALETAVARYGIFLGLPPRLQYRS